MNINLKELALSKAKELYPEATIDELIINASKLEAYFAIKQHLDSLPVFASNCFIQHPVKGSVHFTPYRKQLEALAELQNNNRILIHASRQTGSTMLMCMAALWDALRAPNQNIVVMSKTFTQTQEIRERLEYAHYNLMGIYPKLIQKDRSALAFDNGSRIHFRAVTDTALRGMSVSSLYLDNAGAISHNTLYDMWRNALPAIGASGRIVLVHSGRCPEAGLFYDLWSNDSNQMTKIKLHWSDHPDRDAAWAQDMRAQFGRAAFNAEFECEFVSKPN